MAHFAEINPDTKIVLRVSVIEQDEINTGNWGDPKNWIQTSYNTREGIHEHGGTPLRKNYAGIGYKYHSDIDAFVPPKPYPSWELNNQKGIYESPKPCPQNGKNHTWSESEKNWIAVKL